MSLATLFNSPLTEQDLLTFAFSNQDHHRLIAAAISNQKNVQLPLFPLDPIPMFDLSGWAQSHQQMHTDFTSTLGISGVDLSDVNFKDPAQLSAWIILHASEHRQAEDILGIGR
jgi:hypothetical protein